MAEGGQAVGGATLTGNVGVPNLTFANPFPGTSTTGPNTYPFAVSNDQHLQDPYIQQYNFTVEQTLPGQFQLTTSYVGAKDTHLTVTYPGGGSATLISQLRCSTAFSRPAQQV